MKTNKLVGLPELTAPELNEYRLQHVSLKVTHFLAFLSRLG